MPIARTDTNDPDDDADNRRPDRSGIRIRPKADGCSDDVEDERTRANDEQTDADFDPRGLKIRAHVAPIDGSKVRPNG